MGKLYSSIKATFLLICLLTLYNVAEAQVLLTTTSYEQNFNTLTIAKDTWSNGSSNGNLSVPQTLEGWYALQDLVRRNPPLTVPAMVESTRSTGNTQNDKIVPISLVNYIHNPATPEDRSFGFSTGTFGNPTGYYGVWFRNNTESDIKEIKIEFDIKTIYDDGNKQNGLNLFYRVGTNLKDIIYDTHMPNWVTIVTNINNSKQSFGVVFLIDVPKGQEFFIKLEDEHSGGGSNENDDDLAIDNFKITTSSIPGVLPVTLSSFNGTRSGDVVNLAWATASEKDNDFFEVQQSEDGKSFRAVGERVKGAGTTAVAQSYKATISAQTTNTTYFRLKQVDFDGKFEYSKVIAVKGTGKTSTQASLGVYPNPTSSKVFVTSTQGNGPATVTLFHSSGRAVSRQQVKVEAGQPITLDLAGQVPGVYYVQVQTDAGKSTTRVVKQ